MVIYLSALLPKRIKRLKPMRSIGVRPCTGLGFQSRGLATAGRALLPHDFTFTRLPFRGRRAVYFLLHYPSFGNFFPKARELPATRFSDQIGGCSDFPPGLKLARLGRATTRRSVLIMFFYLILSTLLGVMHTHIWRFLVQRYLIFQTGSSPLLRARCRRFCEAKRPISGACLHSRRKIRP